MKIKNGKKIILLIILALLVILGSFIIYNKVFNDTKNKEIVTMPDNSYIGIWIQDEKYPTNADELTILEINENTIKFKLEIYRIIGIEATAKIEDNIIKFTGKDDMNEDYTFSGTLVFSNKTIKLSLEKHALEEFTDKEYIFTFKKLDNEEILNGDFSNFAGEYINQDGEKITLLQNGKIAEHNNDIIGNVIKNDGIDEATKAFAGTYSWAYEPDGIDAILFPVGVEVWDSSGDEVIPTDTSKIRLFVGQGIGEENIYYKK